MSKHPELVWAQRKDKVYVTVQLPDAKDPKVDLTPDGKLTYSAKAGPEGESFDLDLDLFDKVDVEESKISHGLRHSIIVVAKAEPAWWKRLTKGEGKAPPYIKVDWSKWVDEDEEESLPAGGGMDFGGMDFSNFGGAGGGDMDFSKLMGGAAGKGGADAGLDDDEDDEDLPELEK